MVDIMSVCPSFIQITNVDEQRVVATINILTREIDEIEFTLNCKYVINI